MQCGMGIVAASNRASCEEVNVITPTALMCSGRYMRMVCNLLPHHLAEIHRRVRLSFVGLLDRQLRHTLRFCPARRAHPGEHVLSQQTDPDQSQCTKTGQFRRRQCAHSPTTHKCCSGGWLRTKDRVRCWSFHSFELLEAHIQWMLYQM